MSPFTDNWYPPEQLRDLCGLLGSVLGDGVVGDYIEIGCWEGRSTVHLARTLGFMRRLWAIDTWKGNVGEGPDHPTVVAARDRDVFKTFLGNLVEAGVADHVDVVPQDGRDWLRAKREFVTARIAFLHIDADHTYEVTRDLIQLAFPLMAPGGVICGDDYLNSEAVRRGVVNHLPGWMSKGNLWWTRKLS